MSKPKIGQQIRFTELGAGVYFNLNGCWPPEHSPDCHGVLGYLESIGAMQICTVRQRNGETVNFIWRFSDGLNSHFTWDSKNEFETNRHP